MFITLRSTSKPENHETASKTNAIIDITCDVLGDSVIMKTELDGDASLELNAASKISGDFRKIFKKNLEIL